MRAAQDASTCANSLNPLVRPQQSPLRLPTHTANTTSTLTHAADILLPPRWLRLGLPSSQLQSVSLVAWTPDSFIIHSASISISILYTRREREISHSGLLRLQDRPGARRQKDPQTWFERLLDEDFGETDSSRKFVHPDTPASQRGELYKSRMYYYGRRGYPLAILNKMMSSTMK